MHRPNQSSIAERMGEEMELLREQSQFRTLDIPAGVNLCSNDYLGLATDPRLRRAVQEAVACARAVGSTGSRLLSGNSEEWEKLESEFASFASTEAALYFNSGYAANVGLLGAILKPADVVFSDALNHASLIDGIRLSGAKKVIYPHRDLRFLEKSLCEHNRATGARVIVTESLFSMEGDFAPIRELIRIARDHGAELVLDEAHATGVRGPQGRGIAAENECEREILAIVHTCGKALASAGAFVCGSKELKRFLVNRARTFIFSTAMPPYFASQIRAALRLAREADTERDYLREIGSELRESLSASGMNYGTSASQIVPVLLGSNELALHTAEQLQANGFAARAIRPPTVPAGAARIRLSLTCKIGREDIRRLVTVLNAARESLPQLSAAGSAHV